MRAGTKACKFNAAQGGNEGRHNSLQWIADSVLHTGAIRAGTMACKLPEVDNSTPSNGCFYNAHCIGAPQLATLKI
eukprot:1161048-Pelagomonas_calceolata.AAC.1